jgi:hypothetical protein
MPKTGGRIDEPNRKRLGVLKIYQSARELRLARRRIPNDHDGRAAEPARTVERMKVRWVHDEDKRHQNLNGGDRGNDRGPNPAGEAKPRKRLSYHAAGCLIAWT